MRIVHVAFTGCALWLGGLLIGVQAPVHPDLSGVWVFVRDPGASTNASAVFGDRFTIEQDAEAVVITRTMMVRRIPGPAAAPEAVRSRYPFNGAETRGPSGCPVSKTGWDGPTLIIVTTSSEAAGCMFVIAEQFKDVLHLDNDGQLIVERTLIARNEMRNLVFRPAGRAAPGENPPVVTIARYKKAGLLWSD
jgi:hypothetical protein